MQRLTLTDEQAECLVEVLETTLSDLRMEISHTDSSTFRETLKRRKVLLQEVATAIEEPVGTAR